MSLRAIVFDFDGVLANSEPLHLRAFQDVLADEGIALSKDDYYAHYLGYDDVGVFRLIGAQRAGWSDRHITDLVLRKAARMEVLEQEGAILFPGAAHAIRRAAAVVPIAIASGAFGHEIRRVLDREGLSSLFAAIVGAEDTPASKPAPDPYLSALARLASLHGPVAATECVAVEDSVWGLDSARAAGLRTVAVAQSYPRETLTAADIVIDRISDFSVSALEILCAT